MSEASRHRLGCEAQFAQRLKHHCTLVTALRVAPGERRPAVSPHSKEVRYSDQPRRALTLSASEICPRSRRILYKYVLRY